MRAAGLRGSDRNVGHLAASAIEQHSCRLHLFTASGMVQWSRVMARMITGRPDKTPLIQMTSGTTIAWVSIGACTEVIVRDVDTAELLLR